MPEGRSASIASTCDSVESTMSNTMIIIDWDDTVLPTTWLRQHKFLAQNICEMSDNDAGTRLPAEVKAMMLQLENDSIEMIQEAQKYGRVVFVTNSSTQWIPFTAKRYFTKLRTLVESMEVYSARPEICDQFPSAMVYVPSMAVNWKTDKFRDLCEKHQYGTVVSIGDGFAERCAVLALRTPATKAVAVRLALQPSIDLVIQQLQQMTVCMQSVSRECDNTGEVILTNSGYSFFPFPPMAPRCFNEFGEYPFASYENPTNVEVRPKMAAKVEAAAKTEAAVCKP